MKTIDFNNIKHSSVTNEHYTPPEIAQKAGTVMGGPIDLDPASCRLANVLIQAKQYYSIEEGTDGLKQSWKCDRLFLNPPGGKVFGSSQMAIWFMALEKRWKDREVGQAVFVGFQLSVLRTCPSTLSLPFCIPKTRIHFWTSAQALKDAERGKSKPNLAGVDQWIQRCVRDGNYRWGDGGDRNILVPSRSPSHDNVIIFLPPLNSEGIVDASAISRFRREFAGMGGLANCG